MPTDPNKPLPFSLHMAMGLCSSTAQKAVRMSTMLVALATGVLLSNLMPFWTMHMRSFSWPGRAQCHVFIFLNSPKNVLIPVKAVELYFIW